MQHVAIYFNQPGKLDYPFTNSEYLRSYKDFTNYAAERGMTVSIVRGKSYLGQMRFSSGWRFVGNDLKEQEEAFAADLIYNKESSHDLQIDPDDLVINDPVFDKIGRNKWLTAQAFPDLCPPTYEITSENWREVLQHISTDTIVLKPVSGTEGKGIHIIPKNTLDFSSLNLKGLYIAQEFVDSSGGIPGVCKGMHDLRILIFNGELKLSFIRQPKPGLMLSNVAQGGSSFAVDIKKMPPQILKAAQSIDDYYQQYPWRVYAADFFMQGDRAYLIETNTRPGFPRVESLGQAYTTTFYAFLYRVFLDAINQRRSYAEAQ